MKPDIFDGWNNISRRQFCYLVGLVSFTTWFSLRRDVGYLYYTACPHSTFHSLMWIGRRKRFSAERDETSTAPNLQLRNTLRLSQDYCTHISYRLNACHGFSVENVYALSQGCLPNVLNAPSAHTHHPRCPELTIPLSCDHLIVLIHYNVWRACLSNLMIMGLGNLVNTECDLLTSEPSLTPIPLNLFPTSLQQQVPHSS